MLIYNFIVMADLGIVLPFTIILFIQRIKSESNLQ